jgi:hypothetical protein
MARPAFRPSLLLLLACTAAIAAGRAAPARAQMPFSDYTGRRGMSPYTALGFQGGSPFGGDTLNAYQNLVRPQQLIAAQGQQQRMQNRQLGRLQNQVRSMERGAAAPTTNTIRSTGHSATFMNRSHFYPQ